MVVMFLGPRKQREPLMWFKLKTQRLMRSQTLPTTLLCPFCHCYMIFMLQLMLNIRTNHNKTPKLLEELFILFVFIKDTIWVKIN